MGIGGFHFRNKFCHGASRTGGYRETGIGIADNYILVEHIRSGRDQRFVLSVSPEGDLQFLGRIIHIDQFGRNKQRLRRNEYRL